jgi:hypothetical protein
VLGGIAEKYHRWRRRAIPASVGDIEWRHEHVSRRLDQIERTLSSRFPEATPSPEQQREVVETLRLLEPKSVVGVSKVRVGSAGDGGYVQLDDLVGVTRAFSFGISDNCDWDFALAQAGIPVEQFDHTIEAPPIAHPLLHFHRTMISAEATSESAALPDLVARHAVSDDPHLILKIDIEGCEWDVFDRAGEETLAKLSQIVCEFHDLSDLGAPALCARAKRVFAKLDRLFAPIHVHGNNVAGLCNVANLAVPDVLEVTFANRRRYRFAESSEIFPTPLDAPSNPGVADIWLGPFRF